MKKFDGNSFAKHQLEKIKEDVKVLAGKDAHPKVVSVVFTDDPASLLYTKYKQQSAKIVGIKFKAIKLKMSDSYATIKKAIIDSNLDESVTGVMIQKPSKMVWQSNTKLNDFNDWWQRLVVLIDPSKDVDGLHPSTLEAIKRGGKKKDRKLLPATAQAVLDILDESAFVKSMRVVVIGRSNIVGKPVYFVLKNQGVEIDLLGKQGLKEHLRKSAQLTDYDVVISATGVEGLITGEMVKKGVILIDVGEPKPDIDLDSVKEKAGFITPVPGGVGPVTVACLMKNAVRMVQ